MTHLSQSASDTTEIDKLSELECSIFIFFVVVENVNSSTIQT